MKPETRIRMRYVLADFFSTNLAVFLFNIFRYYELPKAYTTFLGPEYFLKSPMVVAGQIFFPLGMLLVYYLSGIYSRVYLRSRVTEFLTTLSTAAIGTLLIIFVALINDLSLDRTRDYSLFFVAFALLFVIVYIPRLLLTLRMQRRIVRGDVCFNTLIIGYSDYPGMFREQIGRLLPNLGMRVVGLVDEQDSPERLPDIDGLPLYRLKEISGVIFEKNIERIIIIPHPDSWHRTVKLINSLIPYNRPLLIPAETLPPLMFSASIVSLRSEPYIDISSSRRSASTMNIKRAFDVLISVIVLLVTFIPGLFVALAVKLDSPGPVFYTQRRVGRHYRPFTIIKLRTMKTDAEIDGVEMLSHKGDPRVTRVGRFLRRYRLDEFPQFLNVLIGDMSIVGPRPERYRFVREIIRREPAYTFVFSVRPGITSLGMVKFGYASSIDEIMRRTRYDILYVEHLSVINDLKIILHTVNTVLSGKGV